MWQVIPTRGKWIFWRKCSALTELQLPKKMLQSLIRMATGKGINLALANMKCFGRPGKEYVFRVGWWITIRAFVPPYELRMHYFGEEFGEKSIITEIDNYVEINFGLFICEVVLLDDEQWQPMKWIPFFSIFSNYDCHFDSNSSIEWNWIVFLLLWMTPFVFIIYRDKVLKVSVAIMMEVLLARYIIFLCPTFFLRM